MKLLALPLRPCRQCLYSVVCSVVGKIVPSPSLGYPLRHLLCWASYSDSTDIVARWPSSSLMSTRPKDDFFRQGVRRISTPWTQPRSSGWSWVVGFSQFWWARHSLSPWKVCKCLLNLNSDAGHVSNWGLGGSLDGVNPWMLSTTAQSQVTCSLGLPCMVILDGVALDNSSHLIRVSEGLMACYELPAEPRLDSSSRVPQSFPCWHCAWTFFWWWWFHTFPNVLDVCFCGNQVELNQSAVSAVDHCMLQNATWRENQWLVEGEGCESTKNKSGWWCHFFDFTPIWGRFPFWLQFF